MSKIKLYYLTTNGCEWLEKEVTLSDINFGCVIREYYNTHQSLVKSLEHKWQMNGEDVQIFIECENIDASIGLFKKIVYYIDTLFE